MGNGIVFIHIKDYLVKTYKRIEMNSRSFRVTCNSYVFVYILKS